MKNNFTFPNKCYIIFFVSVFNAQILCPEVMFVKNKKSNIFGKLTVLLIAVAVVCVFYHKYTAIADYNDQIDSLKTQISEQKKYGEELDKTAKEYDTDKYIEKYARMLGLVKSNEKIFRNYNEKK